MRTIFSRQQLLQMAVMVLSIALVLACGCKRDQAAALVGAADAGTGEVSVDSSIVSQPEVVNKIEDADADESAGGTDAVSPDNIAIDVSPVAATDPLCIKDILPEPGQACASLGEIRCTNFGATLSESLLKFCFRPYSVVCALGADGGAQWQLTPCANVVPNSKHCREPGCLIWGSEHLCQPTVLDPKGAKVKYGMQYYEDFQLSTTRVCPNHLGWQQCAGFAISKCATLADLKELSVPTEVGYGECGKYLKKGSYLLYTEICQGELTCLPKTQQNPDGNGHNTYFITKCMFDPATKLPVCQKTCKDVGVPGY